MDEKQSVMGKLSWGKALWGIVGMALFLRLWGITYGLPFVFWTDEYHEVMRAMELGAGGFNLERTGKGGFYFLLFLEYGFYFAFLKLTGVIGSIREFAELFLKDPTMFYLLGRITAALLGCATVAFAYLIARNAYRPAAGLLSALFIGVNVLHVDLSHRVGVDVPMTLFATMALYFAGRIADGGGRRDYVLAGLCAALATTTKLPGIVVLLPLAIAHFYNVGAGIERFRRWVTSADVWIALTLFFAVWVGTNPGILLAGDLFALFTDSSGQPPEELINGARRPNLWLFYLNALQASMGWPLFQISLGGIVYALWKRRPIDVMLLAYGVINYVAISSTTSENLYFPRYTLPIIVVLSILGARAVVELLGLIPKWRAAVSTAFILLLVAWPLTYSSRLSYSLTQTDTRTLAKKWFDSNVPVGSHVLIEGGKIAVSRLTVPLIESRESLDRRIEYWKSAEPRQAQYLQIRQATHEGGGYKLELVKIDKVEPLENYLGQGVEYFVVRPESFLGSRRADSNSAVFLRSLREDARIQLAARFDAVESLRQGPPIEIYRIEHMSLQER